MYILIDDINYAIDYFENFVYKTIGPKQLQNILTNKVRKYKFKQPMFSHIKDINKINPHSTLVLIKTNETIYDFTELQTFWLSESLKIAIIQKI